MINAFIQCRSEIRLGFTMVVGILYICFETVSLSLLLLLLSVIPQNLMSLDAALMWVAYVTMIAEQLEVRIRIEMATLI